MILCDRFFKMIQNIFQNDKTNKKLILPINRSIKIIISVSFLETYFSSF